MFRGLVITNKQEYLLEFEKYELIDKIDKERLDDITRYIKDDIWI